MKERPILFNGDMVRAILEGRKTQTRRIVKGIPDDMQLDDWDPDSLPVTMFFSDGGDVTKQIEAPYEPGDLLWVREKFLIETSGSYRFDAEGLSPGEYPEWLQRGSQVHYAATTDLKSLGLWKPSIHMPRWASRITLKVTSVRVERLNDISGEDCVAEGIPYHEGYPIGFYKMDDEAARASIHQGEFRNLWQSINGAGSWAANPWVWVIEFEVQK